MFLGTVPDKCINQIIRINDFSKWSEVYVCCSGTFRLERAILQKWPEAKVVSNDVSVFTTPLGMFATGVETPITFVGDLAFVEDVIPDGDYLSRIAAVLVSSDYSKFAAGKPNAYKESYKRYYHAHFPELVAKTREKVARIAESLNISGFNPVDWLEHAREAMARGAGIVAFPPFYKGGYEILFKYINDNIEWDAPNYEIYDPESLGKIIDEVDASGVPFCILSDQHFDHREPVLEFHSGRHVPHYCFTKTEHSSYVRTTPRGTPFTYMPLDVSLLKKNTKVDVVEASADALTFLKNVYLKKNINHTPGMANFLIYLDGMLAGALVYSLDKFGDHSGIYLLSDFSTTTDAKISKMVARMALSGTILDVLNKRYIQKFKTVTTTAFTHKPVAMKYRGVYELSSRKKSDNPKEGNVLQYCAEVIEEDPRQIFRWWWQRHGQKFVAEARNRNTADKPKNSQAA